MIHFQFISAENGKLRILFNNEIDHSSSTKENTCTLSEVTDLSIRLHSQLSEINQNLHKQTKLFNQ